MIKRFLSVAVLAILVAGLAVSTGVLAQEPTNGLPTADELNVTGAQDLITKIDTVTNWIFAVFVAIAVIYIVLAAFQFVTGGGKPEEISMARQKLIYAAIGIAIALLARAIPVVIRNIVAPGA